MHRSSRLKTRLANGMVTSGEGDNNATAATTDGGRDNRSNDLIRVDLKGIC